MTTFCLLLILVTFHASLSGPFHRKAEPFEGDDKANHQVENIEIHHDLKAGKGQELIDDSLPEKDLKNDINNAAGDGKQPNQLEVAEEKLLKLVEGRPHDDKPAQIPAKESDIHHEQNKVENEIHVLSEETAKKLKKLPVEQLIPVDHLDIVRMEQDGHINKEYHKEMFLGGLHDEFRAETVDQASVKLQEIVARADLNQDGFLSAEEMEKWILNKMLEHFDAAKKENDMIFEHLDPDEPEDVFDFVLLCATGDGFIKWKEYYVHFLLSRGYDPESAVKHVVDYDDAIKLEQEGLRKMTTFCLLLILVTFHASLSGPFHRKAEPFEGDDKANHQVENIEIHHDLKAGKGQELIDDSLPEKDLKNDINNDAAGDGKQPNELEVAEEKLLKLVEGRPHDDKPAQIPAKESKIHHEQNKAENEIHVLSGETAKRLKKLPVEQLIPVDHLDIVRMEQDGHINKEYHKEMFLGGLHDEFRAETVDQASVKLQEIVARADLNQDGFLSAEELEKWILNKMLEHFDTAKKENDMIFEHLDPDGDGFIKWKEYYVHFLLSRGNDPESAVKHVVDYDDAIKLEQEDKDALISYKFKWTDADTNITDNRLSKEEFMVFRHPEHSHRSLESMVFNVMRGVDVNNDKVITEEEFAALPPGEVEGKEFQDMDRKWQDERRKEFREIMDTNGDGKVDLTELKNYLDPMKPVQAKVEADSLMSLMDDDKDSRLSMEEILKHADIIIYSKMVNYAANLHDEF
ncbi:45 kDa calcium-binding protein [Bulinus truncatus]|nr:45 kDa calcium-binding protein [Bulinus truncatus]